MSRESQKTFGCHFEKDIGKRKRQTLGSDGLPAEDSLMERLTTSSLYYGRNIRSRLSLEMPTLYSCTKSPTAPIAVELSLLY
ncbi:hypothetical protein BgiBS90_028106 [Biomphalaria glabrata]|nr:hypothetical protein BgiBS90_028106 [Biomphalaria glabrata]